MLWLGMANATCPQHCSHGGMVRCREIRAHTCIGIPPSSVTQKYLIALWRHFRGGASVLHQSKSIPGLHSHCVGKRLPPHGGVHTKPFSPLECTDLIDSPQDQELRISSYKQHSLVWTNVVCWGGGEDRNFTIK